MKLIQLLKELEIGNPNQILDTKSSIDNEFNLIFRQLKRIDPKVQLRNNHFGEYANIVIQFSDYMSYIKGTKILKPFIEKYMGSIIEDVEGSWDLLLSDFDNDGFHYLIDYRCK